jgi:hypothetical protein
MNISAVIRACVTHILLCALVVISVACAATSKTVRYNGTYYANTGESHLLPGQFPPKDFVATYKDDGTNLQTTQTFTDDTGVQHKYQWSGACDGMPRPISGIEAPATVSLSCRRMPTGALVNVLTGSSGYTHTETCTLTNRGRKEVCQGTATSPEGEKMDFLYVFDRK